MPSLVGLGFHRPPGRQKHWVFFCLSVPLSVTFLLNSNISSTCLHNMVNFRRLTAEIGWWVCGTSANFSGFRVLASLLHRRRSTKLCTMSGRLLGWYTIYTDEEPYSSSSLDGIWSRDGSFNSGIRGINRQEAGHRWTSPWTEETCTDGICRRCAITKPSHGRHGEPVRWIQQWSSCPEQLRCCGHSSGRHSAADGETWTRTVWDTRWTQACEPDSAYHRSHQVERPPSFQPPTSQREVNKTATYVISEVS